MGVIVKSLDEIENELADLIAGPEAVLIQQYLKDPNFCPYCEDHEIEATRFDVEGRIAWQWVRCDTCGAEWHDIFELRAIERVEIP
tara:strand:+ start:180 stop:437 length:258 start_codon:yes stop_codon:yes gene_type:complete